MPVNYLLCTLFMAKNYVCKCNVYIYDMIAFLIYQFFLLSVYIVAIFKI